MATLSQQLEARFDHWLSLNPRMEDNQRKYLSAHAWCALGDVAEHLGPHLPFLDRTVAGLQNRRGNGVAALDYVNFDMALHYYMHHAILAYRTWLSELEERRPSRSQMAFVVRKHLFAGNEAGWAAYVAHVRKSAPWFDVQEPGDDDNFHPRGGKLATLVRVFFVN